jgi:sirohydrochlorin cobaltochelatase
LLKSADVLGGHGQDHHHHPYPHADHPLGPVTLPRVQGVLARRERERGS